MEVAFGVFIVNQFSQTQCSFILSFFSICVETWFTYSVTSDYCNVHEGEQARQRGYQDSPPLDMDSEDDCLTAGSPRRWIAENSKHHGMCVYSMSNSLWKTIALSDFLYFDDVIKLTISAGEINIGHSLVYRPIYSSTNSDQSRQSSYQVGL